MQGIDTQPKNLINVIHEIAHNLHKQRKGNSFLKNEDLPLSLGNGNKFHRISPLSNVRTQTQLKCVRAIVFHFAIFAFASSVDLVTNCTDLVHAKRYLEMIVILSSTF